MNKDDKTRMLNSRSERAFSEKAPWNSLYNMVYDFCDPTGNGFYHPKGNTTDTSYSQTLWTSVGIVGASVFVSRMLSYIMPPVGKWINLNYNKADGRDEVQPIFNIIADRINQIKKYTNAVSEVSEWLKELVAGTAVLMIDRDMSGIFFKAIPLNEVAIAKSLRGNYDVFRKLKMRLGDIPHTWWELSRKKVIAGDEITETSMSNEVEVIESTCYNPDTNKFDYTVMYKRQIIVERTMNTSPFIVAHWSKRPKDSYGSGVGLIALPEIKTLNRIIHYNLDALKFTIPTFLAQESDSLDPLNFEFEPGVLNFVPSTATNHPSIVPLQINPNNAQMVWNIQNSEMNIKQIMLDVTIPNDPSRMTATEIATRVNELATQTTAPSARLAISVYQMVYRIVDIMLQMGELDIQAGVPVFTLEFFKQNCDIDIVSTLGSDTASVQQIMQYIQYMQLIDPTGRLLQVSVPKFKVAEKIGQYMNIESDMMLSADDMQRQSDMIDQQIAAAQQQQLAMQVQAENAIDDNKTKNKIVEARNG